MRKFLIMARISETKTLACSENPSEWIQCYGADLFKPGQPLYAGDAVYDKICRHAWENKDSNPGFAVVDESRLPEVERAAQVVVLGNVEALGEVAGTAKLPEPKEPEGPTAEDILPVVTTPDEERLDCPLCAAKFNDEVSLQDHMGFHKQQKAKYKALRAKRGKLEG